MKVNTIKVGDLVHYPGCPKRLALVLNKGIFPKSFIVEFLDNGNKIDMHQINLIRSKDES
tara:strand:+ start:327 stop:506 length:180 start_codon:yes stop_codon:yes gene_type:complete